MIRLRVSATDRETRQQYAAGQEIDLGTERNEAAVNNGWAVWVRKEEKAQETEKKEETPGKTTSRAKGKKIETK